jgi:hypothetical protein
MLVVRVTIFMLGLSCPCYAIPGFLHKSAQLPLFGNRGSFTKRNYLSISAMVPAHTITDLSVSAVTYNAISHCLTGGLAASASHGLTVPLDVIKTRLQTDENFKNAGVFSTALKVTRLIPFLVLIMF